MDNFDKELSAAKGQRTEAWKEQRLGKVTASKCKVWMSKGRGKDQEFGQTALTYLYGVLAEKLTGSQHAIFGAALDWGEIEEEQAIARYKEVTGNIVQKIGYVPYSKDNQFGGSPDGLIGNDGMLEVKCPFNPANHVQTMVTNDIYNEDHRMQIQANLLFTGRKWCDYVTYDPRVLEKDQNIKILEIGRDQETIEKIEARVIVISEWLNETMKVLNQR